MRATAMAWCVTLATATLASPAGAQGVTTVQVTDGVPRLLVDGVPVRPRMFYGGPGRAPIPIQAGPREAAFEFVAMEDETGGGTMHVRFGATPGTVVLDDLRVVDLATGREVLADDFEAGEEAWRQDWTHWPTGAENPVGAVQRAPGRGRGGSHGMQVTLRAPPAGAWPDFHIYCRPHLSLQAGHRYRVSFWADAEPGRELVIAFYRPGAVFTLLGGPNDVFEAQIRLAAGAGVDFVSFGCALPWPEPGVEPDWRGVESACRRVLTANPRARLLPRIGMTPPAWWLKAHPEAVMTWEGGAQQPRGFSVASPAYRADAAARLAALVRHLEARFGERLAGYHPCGQNTGEWFYQETWGRRLSDYSEATRAAWEAWLRERYGADAGLQAAWGQAEARLTGVAIPAPERRHAAPDGVLRDPAHERDLIDWAEFQQVAMADCVIALAKAVREASEGRRLVVFFYGYGYEFGAVGTGPAVSGHYALRRVLACPEIDVLCSPISYWDRGLGQSAPTMSAAESVALAGKLWLREDDTATHLSSGQFPGWQAKAKNGWETLTQLQRNVAREALQNQASWWMDLGATGWFNDPALWEGMRQLEAIDGPLRATPRPYRPEVAAILDERSMDVVAAGGQVVTRPAVYEVRTALGRCGAPYGQYLLDDVAAGRVPARLRVFLNAYLVPGALRARLRQATAAGVNLWCYAPGCLDETGRTTPGMQELTGFEVEPATPVQAWAEPTAAGRALGLTQGFGVKGAIKPLWAVRAGPGVEVLAVYPDGTAAVARRRQGAGATLWVGVPGLTAEILRLAARLAGVHLYTETDCNVYANGPFVALHAAQDGALTLDTGTPGAVRDVLSGEVLGQGPRLPLSLRLGETRILRCE